MSRATTINTQIRGLRRDFRGVPGFKVISKGILVDTRINGTVGEGSQSISLFNFVKRGFCINVEILGLRTPMFFVVGIFGDLELGVHGAGKGYLAFNSPVVMFHAQLMVISGILYATGGRA
jgi:hypothetical protein